MKPINVKCPICGEYMMPTEWGAKRQVHHRNIGNIPIPGETNNYVHYICPCGCKIEYEGTKSCWKKCPCQG